MTARKIIKVPKCHVCASPDRALIEHARVAGIGLDQVAAKYKISRDAIWRHMKNHVDDEARADYLAQIPMSELAERAAAEGQSVLQYFSIVRATLMSQFQLAASLNDRNATATLAGRLVETLREIGRITGELGDMSARNLTVNNTVIMNSPAVASLQAAILAALVPYPDARNAVVMALQQIDQQVEPMKAINHVPKTIEHIA